MDDSTNEPKRPPSAFLRGGSEFEDNTRLRPKLIRVRAPGLIQAGLGLLYRAEQIGGGSALINDLADAKFPETLPVVCRNPSRVNDPWAGITSGPRSLDEGKPIKSRHAQVRDHELKTAWVFVYSGQGFESICRGAS